MTTRIKLRRDTAANWTTSNPILAAGEPGLETDTGKIKYGDGVTRWNVLEHAGGDTLTNDSSITVQTGDADRWFVRLRREDQTENPDPYVGVIVTSTNYDSEGNAIVAAVLELNSDGVVVFKFTPAGELVWKKSLDAVDGSWYIESNVVIDSSDNILFVVNPDSSTTKTIVKLNGETGAVVFSENFFNENEDSLTVSSIAVDSSGNIIIGGYFFWPENNNCDTAFVAKLNSTADSVTWQKSFSIESNYSKINALEVDFNDDIIVAGYANLDHVVDGETVQDERMLVAKITSSGTVDWQKGISLEDVNEGKITGISLDSLGNIYATGSYYVDTGTTYPWGGQKSNAIVVFKMTTLGVVVWDRRVGPGQCSWVGTSTAVGDDGDLYLYASTYQRNTAGEAFDGNSSDNGYWNATLALARYNKATGAVIWQSYFDNPHAQEIPAFGGDAPWGGNATDLMTVKDNKILIGGAVRLGQSNEDIYTPWSTGGDYFNQGFLAQFDTDATRFSAEGWTLETSRIPGKLTNTLVAVDTGLTLQNNDIALSNQGTANIETQAVGVSVRRTASKVNTWTFGKDGTFSAPEDANIKLNQKQLGYVTLYGVKGQDESDIWFESVVHDADGFAYAIGSDNWNGDFAHFYKFTPEGAVVWKTQLYAGSGASFYVEWSGGEYTVATVDQGGNGYKVGDRIVLPGSQLGGTDGINSLTLEVATLTYANDYVGGVATVNIISGVPVDGSSDVSNVQDYYDNAECEVRSLAFDPVTGNPVALISTPTYNGDTLDNTWTETVLVMLDSGSGAVVKTTTLADEGDIYANDISVSSTGNVAVVGSKYNEYTEYGAVTPLTGSAVQKLWVAKSDIDAEHFPGEANGNYYDWFITGSSITDQVQVQGVNNYTGLTTTVREGSGAAFDVTVSQPSTLATITEADLATATATGTTVKNSDNIVTPGGWGNWIVFPDSALRVTLEGLFTGNQVVPVQWDTGSTSATGYIMIQFPGDGTFQITPVTADGSSAVAGTWYFDALLKGIGSYSVLVTANGSNYLTGHKVKVLGSALGGTTPENDLIIVMDSVSGGVINSVSNTGTPNAAAIGPYTSVAHTNYNVGSGATFNLNFNPVTGAYESWGTLQSGQNYAFEDILTISGTQFAGGATPDNDITFRVSSPGGGGTIDNIDNVSGSVPSTHLLVSTAAGADFSDVEATFAIKQSLGGEAFIWTEDFNKAIGGGNTDWFSGVAWNADGTNLYAVGSGRYEVTYDQALVVKYSSTGTLVASKFINDDMNSNSADGSGIALMADDSIVVVHNQYNPDRDETNEVLVTKLDSDLNIVWQQFIGVDSEGDGWSSPGSDISVAVDPATDEILIAWEAYDDSNIINDDAIHIVKLDTDGEVVWKRMFGIHESDTGINYSGNGNKALSIHGDKFTLVGHTDGPNDDSDNAFIVTLPLDGTGVGLHGLWTYRELNDDRIKVWRLSGRTSSTFVPTVHTGAITATDNVKYYYTNYPNEEFTFYPQTILSNEGGAIEFADGSKQTFSTALVPQVAISAGRYTIRAEDSGRHILITQQNNSIVIPNYQTVTLPVGFTVTIVNTSDNTVYVENEDVNNSDLRGRMWFSGGDEKTPVVGINDNGSGQMVTLMKIKEGTQSDDGEIHGDVWMIAGADIFNDW